MLQMSPAFGGESANTLAEQDREGGWWRQ